MRNTTLALLVVATLFAAACSGGTADGTAPSATAPSTATEAASNPSIADVVANAANAAGATDGTAGPTGTTDTAPSASETKPAGATVAPTRATQLKVNSVERQRLVQAIQTTESLDAYEFEWAMAMPGFPDLPGGLNFGGSGAIDPTAGRFAMTIDFTQLLGTLTDAEGASAEDLALLQGFFGDEPMEMRYIDGTIYMSWPLFGMLLGADTRWIAFDDPTGTEGFGALPTGGAGGIANPLDATAFLDDVWGIEEVGRETVRGVDTTHYRGVIDIVQAMGALSPDQLAELEAELNGASPSDVFGEFPVDVWIDDDNVMRRFSLELDFSGFADAGATAEALIGSMTMSYEFFNIGGDVSIAVPPADDVTEVSDSFFLDGFDPAG